MLSGSSLKEIIADESVPREDIWRGQVQALFPQVDDHRRRLLRKYASKWDVPHVVPHASGEKSIEKLEELEVAHMLYQARHSDVSVDRSDLRLLEYLDRIRRKLAHMNILYWNELSQNPGARAFEIC